MQPGMQPGMLARLWDALWQADCLFVSGSRGADGPSSTATHLIWQRCLSSTFSIEVSNSRRKGKKYRQFQLNLVGFPPPPPPTFFLLSFTKEMSPNEELICILGHWRRLTVKGGGGGGGRLEFSRKMTSLICISEIQAQWNTSQTDLEMQIEEFICIFGPRRVDINWVIFFFSSPGTKRNDGWVANLHIGPAC